MKINGVVTTGIYCRAGCGAKPKAENIRPMPNALAAMVAGYRPCLLCRPDRLPDFGLQQPADEIAQAVRLIAEGFLDHSTTDQLAQRIGYSTRHLVRLFEKHIGATPDFVARAQRAHLARRLLDDSHLTITQIAFSAGFSSLRQMNRVVRELFGFSPSQLRAKRSEKNTLDPLDGGLRLRIPYDGPSDSSSLIEFLRPRAIPGVEEVVDGKYLRTMNTCGHPGVVEVCDVSGENHLDVTMHLATFGSIVEQVDRVRSLFGLYLRPEIAIKKLRRDPIIGRLVREQAGLRSPGTWDRFETSVRIIIGQQVSVRGASTLTGRLVERYGEALPLNLPGSLRFLFPSAKALATADIRDLGMPQSRANTIKNFAAAIVAGDVDLTLVTSLEETIAMLETVPGVGPWTAHFIAGRVMGHQDAFPVGDLGLRRSAGQLLGRSVALLERELLKIAEDWRPYRAVAANYLWTIT